MAAVGRHSTTCLVARKLNSASAFSCILIVWRGFKPKSTAGRNTVHVVPCERHVYGSTAAAGNWRKYLKLTSADFLFKFSSSDSQWYEGFRSSQSTSLELEAPSVVMSSFFLEVFFSSIWGIGIFWTCSRWTEFDVRINRLHESHTYFPIKFWKTSFQVALINLTVL